MTGGGIRELERLRAATEGKARAGLAGRLRTLAGGVRRRAARLLKAPGATASARRRRPDDAALLPQHYRIVELTGPSCIGKTTLHMAAQADLRCDWLLARPKREDAHMALPSEEMRAILDILQLRYGRLVETISTDGLQARDFANRLGMFEFLCGKLRSEVVMRNAAASGRAGYFIDEGIIKASSDVVDRLDDESLRWSLNRRALVFLTVRDIGAVCRRIAERAERGKPSRAYVTCTCPDEAAARVQDRLNRDEILQARCEAFGAPTLRLYADDPLEENVAALCQFERHLMTLGPAVGSAGMQRA